MGKRQTAVPRRRTSRDVTRDSNNGGGAASRGPRALGAKSIKKKKNV